MTLRTTDLEATQAAQAHAAAETARIEQALRAELEAVASREVDPEPDGRVDELKQTIDTIAEQLRAQTEQGERTRTADAKAAKSANDQLRERLDELLALRAADTEATKAAQAQATDAAAGTARVEQALRSELEALASRQAGADPSEGVKKLEQTFEALARTMDDQLATLAAELRAEAAAGTDDTASQLRAQNDELAASIEAIRETVGTYAETKQSAERFADESRSLAARLDELIGLRVSDVEATQAAQAQAAAETSRVEQGLANGLAELAVQVANLEDRLARQSVPVIEAQPREDEPGATLPDAKGPRAKKRSKRDKGKKKPKR
jgi:hypothetical protein